MSIERGNGKRKNHDEESAPRISAASAFRSAEIKSFKEEQIKKVEKQIEAVDSEIKTMEDDLFRGTAHMMQENPKLKELATLLRDEAQKNLDVLKARKAELEASLEKIKNPEKIEDTAELSFE